MEEFNKKLSDEEKAAIAKARAKAVAARKAKK